MRFCGGMAGPDLSGIHRNPSVCTRQVKAKLSAEDLGEGESGYTLARRDGKSSIVVNELAARTPALHDLPRGGTPCPWPDVEPQGGSGLVPWPMANGTTTRSRATSSLRNCRCRSRRSSAVDQEEPSFDLVERLRAEHVVSFSACASRALKLTGRMPRPQQQGTELSRRCIPGPWAKKEHRHRCPDGRLPVIRCKAAMSCGLETTYEHPSRIARAVMALAERESDEVRVSL